MRRTVLRHRPAPALTVAQLARVTGGTAIVDGNGGLAGMLKMINPM